MTKGRRRAYRRVHRAKGFPSCLPAQDDLEAVYLGKKAPSELGVIYDESGNGNDAQLVNSYCLQGDGTVKLIVSDLVGTETVISSEGTSIPTISAGQITFTIGTCWNLVLSSGHIFLFSEGGLTETCINIGVGNDATLYNATYASLWGKQDVFHYNMLNGFDLYENGTSGEEIRVPIGHSFSQSGYTYTATYQAGKWLIGETKIKFPDALSPIQDATPISSLTDNKNLEWVNGEIRNQVQLYISGTSTITEESNGTRFYFPNADSAYLAMKANIKDNTSYNYYIKVVAIAYGYLYIDIGDVNVSVNSVGVTEGVVNVTSGTIFASIKRAVACDCTISYLVIWEEGTVPPLSYEEMESNYNNANRVISSIEDKKHKQLALWNRELTTTELGKALKCVKED